MNTTMNTLKKSLISIGVGLGLTVSGFAQTSGQPIYRDANLLNGWNLYITNGTAVGPGVALQTYTALNGQINLSLTNPVVNGVVQSNVVTADAFNTMGVKMLPDVNGDYNPTMAIHVLLNQTNLIPIAVTNAAGQYFVGTAPTTNSYPYQGITANYLPWPLGVLNGPIWMYPATTNLYVGLPSTTSTNNLTFYFQRGWTLPLGAGQTYTVWDTTTNWFQFTYNGALTGGGAALATGNTPVAIITNVPTSFTQGADRVRCAGISETTGTGNVPSVYIINALTVGQPQP